MGPDGSVTSGRKTAGERSVEEVFEADSDERATGAFLQKYGDGA